MKPTHTTTDKDYIRSIILPVRRSYVAKLLKQGSKPRHIRKALLLTGRQFRKAINEAKGQIYSDTYETPTTDA